MNVCPYLRLFPCGLTSGCHPCACAPASTVMAVISATAGSGPRIVSSDSFNSLCVPI